MPALNQVVQVTLVNVRTIPQRLGTSLVVVIGIAGAVAYAALLMLGLRTWWVDAVGTTALTLHDLSDVMPAKLDMTVPPGFRRMAAIPGVLRLRHARLGERDVQTIDGVRVTTPLRTLIDVIAEGVIAPELQAQAVDETLRRGLIMRRQLETARVSTRARQRIDRILKQVSDGSSTPVRDRRRVSNRTRGAAQ